jgi:hypothetical protein
VEKDKIVWQFVAIRDEFQKLRAVPKQNVILSKNTDVLLNRIVPGCFAP